MAVEETEPRWRGTTRHPSVYLSLSTSEPAPDNKDMQMRAEAASSGSAPERSSLTIAGNKLMCPANCATVAAGRSAAPAKASQSKTVPGGVPPVAK